MHWCFLYIESVKDYVDHYYGYLSVNMDAEVITKLMVSQQLLSEDALMAASNDYQINCLILQQVRMMNLQTILSFGQLLQTDDSQKEIGTMFVDSELIKLLNNDLVAM